MLFAMKKDTRLNVRITPLFRDQIQELADYHGLTLSSYAHSLLVRAVRSEYQTLHADDETRSKGVQNMNTFSPNEIKPARVAQIEHLGETTDEKPSRKRKTG